MKKNGRILAEEEKTAEYKQLGFVSSAFPGNKNVISDVRVPERGEGTMVSPLEAGEKKAARRPHPEQKHYFLLRELVSWLSPPRELVVNLFADTC